LSIGKFFSEQGKSVLILEKESRAGEGISSRNSGVIHSGMYYPADSLKTKFCIEGNKLLYEYAEHKNISHKKTGKYIVASKAAELDKLDRLYQQAITNNVNLVTCSKEEARLAMPEIISAGALFSPETGIIDVPELITALEGDIQHNTGIISFNTTFLSAKKDRDFFKISCSDGGNFTIQAKNLVNAAGLTSDSISRNIEPLNSKHIHEIYFAKGHYFKYSGANPFKSLVYPLADEFSLGIHVCFDMSGQIRFGPDLTWVDAVDFSFDELLKEKFVKSIHCYWPDMEPSKLQPDYVGIRPKIQNATDQMKDFSILGPHEHGVKGLVNLQGIESPGVTSSLAIGKYIASLI
jgi:L-2-hydroxyglutarate oxidase LhgO